MTFFPEAHWVNRKFWYAVRGDDGVLAEGRFGAWILGRDESDVPLKGSKTLVLATRTEHEKENAPGTLFWAGPVIVTADGRELKLSELNPAYDNIHRAPGSGADDHGSPVKIAGRLFTRSVPANPLASGEEGTVTIDLTGLEAGRFKAHVGGDYPLGDETWRRKSLSFRTTGNETRYLTVIEPYEDQAVVKSVAAVSADEATVELVDGRTHVIKLLGLEQGEDLAVRIQEYRDGKMIRS